MCRLCGSTDPLKDSHIIPKFVGRWMKKTSLTPYLRFGEDMDRRSQDLSTLELLCDDCEERFSAWETKFANEIFYPSAEGEAVFRYRYWLSKFAASLAWRGIHYLNSRRTEEEPPDLHLVVDAMEAHLSRFLLDREKSVGSYTQHVYHVGELEAPVEPGSPMLNRYLARTVQIDLLRNDDLSEVLMYVKLPMFMFLSVGESKYRKWLETGRIKKSSTLHPKNYILPEGILNYIIDKSDRSFELLNSMSPKSRAVSERAFMKAVEEDPDRVANSRLMRAMRRDYEFYGKDAVVYRD